MKIFRYVIYVNLKGGFFSFPNFPQPFVVFAETSEQADKYALAYTNKQKKKHWKGQEIKISRRGDKRGRKIKRGLILDTSIFQ